MKPIKTIRAFIPALALALGPPENKIDRRIMFCIEFENNDDIKDVGLAGLEIEKILKLND